jgi:hypothetical protein
MASNTSLSSSASQTVMTNVLQQANNVCSFTCNQNESNITVIVDGGTVGNITFSQDCEIKNTTCNMQTVFETQIQNILDALLKQSAFTANSVLDFNFNAVSENLNIYQYIQNSVSQIISNTCTFSTNQTMSGNYVFVGGGGKAGNIGFLQKSNIDNASCIMNTVAKSVISNQATAKGSQSSTILGTFALLGIVIIIMLVLGGALVFIFVLGGGLKKLKGKGSGTSGNSPSSNELTPQAMNAAANIAAQNPQFGQMATSGRNSTSIRAA